MFSSVVANPRLPNQYIIGGGGGGRINTLGAPAVVAIQTGLGNPTLYTLQKTKHFNYWRPPAQCSGENKRRLWTSWTTPLVVRVLYVVLEQYAPEFGLNVPGIPHFGDSTLGFFGEPKRASSRVSAVLTPVA